MAKSKTSAPTKAAAKAQADVKSAKEVAGAKPAKDVPGAKPLKEVAGAKPAKEAPGAAPAKEKHARKAPGAKPAIETPAKPSTQQPPGKAGTIRAGIGGWTFEPWRGTFYPEKLSQAKELGYAAQQLATIEVNGTYYSTQSPKTFAKWRSETPEGFVFSLKGPRYAVNRRVLGEAGESIERFLKSGLSELGDRLGPLLWQFAPTKKFDAGDFGAFLDLLPDKEGGVPLRHALEVRHPSFCVPEFIVLARKHNAAVVFADHAKYPAIPDVTADFVYARLQRGKDEVPTAYPPKDLASWADRAKAWASGAAPDDLTLVAPEHPAPVKPRDAFVYFIHEGKVRAPQAAMAFQKLS